MLHISAAAPAVAARMLACMVFPLAVAWCQCSVSAPPTLPYPPMQCTAQTHCATSDTNAACVAAVGSTIANSYACLSTDAPDRWIDGGVVKQVSGPTVLGGGQPQGRHVGAARDCRTCSTCLYMPINATSAWMSAWMLVAQARGHTVYVAD